MVNKELCPYGSKWNTLNTLILASKTFIRQISYFHFSQLGVFVRVGYNFGKINSEGQIFDIVSGGSITDETEGDQTNFNVGFGVSYFINDNVGLEAIISYDRFETDYDEFFSDFIIKTLQLRIGLQFYLSKN